MIQTSIQRVMGINSVNEAAATPMTNDPARSQTMPTENGEAMRPKTAEELQAAFNVLSIEEKINTLHHCIINLNTRINSLENEVERLNQRHYEMTQRFDTHQHGMNGTCMVPARSKY